MAGRDIYREIQKRESMQFVYAAFFDDRGDVYVKLGRSGTPYKRILQVASTSPFQLSKAVFSCVGSVKLAESIESYAKHRMDDQRTRGEWYRFGKSDGQVFSLAMQIIYAKVTGRQLKWTVVDVAAIKADMETGYQKLKGLARHDKAA